MSKKILIIANSIVGNPPGVTGGESRFIELAKCWVKKGYEIHLMSGKCGEILCNKFGLRVTLHNISNSEATGRIEIIKRLFKVFVYLPKILRSFDEGIVYSASEQIYDVLPGFFLKRYNPEKIRYGVVVHWLPPILFWTRQGSDLINSLMFLISERIGLLYASLSADILLPVSADTLKDLSRSLFRFKKAKDVICGVNLEEIEAYTKDAREKKYDGVFLKRLQKTKGIFDLIEMWENIVKQKPEAKLLIIGEGIDGEEARELVKEKNLEKNIEFAGVVYDPKEKFKLLAQSKVFILPSYEENWAIVIGEALASGVPVVCYGLEELKKVWSTSVTFVETGNITKLRESVLSILGKENNTLIENGKEYVKKYSWQRIAEEELKIILGEK